jgi:hypothetical protein
MKIIDKKYRMTKKWQRITEYNAIILPLKSIQDSEHTHTFTHKENLIN